MVTPEPVGTENGQSIVVHPESPEETKEVVFPLENQFCKCKNVSHASTKSNLSQRSYKF